MPSPRSLWAGRRPGDHHPDGRTKDGPGTRPLQRRGGGEPPPVDQDTGHPGSGGLATRWLALALAALAGLGGGLLAIALTGDNPLDRSEGPAVSISPGKGRLPEGNVGRVYAAAGPGVVSVQAGSASGTGFVVDRDGTVITNAHVVQGRDRASVQFGDRGPEVRATVLGSDLSSDVAVLRVDPSQPGVSLKPIPLADSNKVKVGDDVVAIGHPFGLDRTATAGIVSGVGRRIQAPNGFEIDSVIQTDAPINPGNSGGPLLDTRGRVVGVNSQIATGGNQGNVGIGFAVPSNTVEDVVGKLKRGEPIRRAYLGVTTSAALGSGVRVEDTASGGPAEQAGIRQGDRIVAIDGQKVVEPDDVSGAVSAKRPGQRIRVEVSRGGVRRTFEARLGTRPQRGP
jgi:putative serine protease PepD